mmetsp:Transcript_7439/g.6771  ORF Transcript_7439/g.6771 Transcript_7439/m.6771 type:complete len:84 (-) Transcript_7439:327-578(-)
MNKSLTQIIRRGFAAQSPVHTYSISAETKSSDHLEWISGFNQKTHVVDKPLEDVLGSLAGCKHATTMFHAKKLKLNVKGIKFT